MCVSGTRARLSEIAPGYQTGDPSTGIRGQWEGGKCGWKED